MGTRSANIVVCPKCGAYTHVKRQRAARRQRDIIDLLWDYLPKHEQHSDRRLTGWGYKSKQGLIASVISAASEDKQ